MSRRAHGSPLQRPRGGSPPLRFLLRVLCRAERARFGRFHETFGHALELFPACANFLRFVLRDDAVRRGLRDRRQHIREFLHNIIGHRNQRPARRKILGIAYIETARLFTDPLRDSRVLRDSDEMAHALERAARAASTVVFGRLRPFVDQRERQAHIGRDLFGAGPLQYFPHHLVRFHGAGTLRHWDLGATM